MHKQSVSFQPDHLAKLSTKLLLAQGMCERDGVGGWVPYGEE